MRVSAAQTARESSRSPRLDDTRAITEVTVGGHPRPTCVSEEPFDCILRQSPCREYTDFREMQFEEEDQLLRRLYFRPEIPEKFQIIWKFYQFSINTPRLYKLPLYKILRKNVMFKRRKREEIMRAILEEISDSQIDKLDLEYVVDYERKKRSMLFEVPQGKMRKGLSPILNILSENRPAARLPVVSRQSAVVSQPNVARTVQPNVARRL